MISGQSEGAQEMGAAIGALGLVAILVMGVLIVAMIAFAIFLWWRIFSRAGYSGAMALLLLLPAGELIMLCILAFGRWPTLRDLERLRNLPPR